jgi:hypothetical protein
MLTLPADIMDLMTPFAPAFTQPPWWKAQQLVVGTILTPGAPDGDGGAPSDWPRPA